MFIQGKKVCAYYIFITNYKGVEIKIFNNFEKELLHIVIHLHNLF